MNELTDDQILSILGRMEQEQKFFDQMHATYAQVGNIIRRFKTIQEKIPDLASEELRLANSIGAIRDDIAAQRRAGTESIQAEFDQLRTNLQEGLVKLKKDTDRAISRRDSAVTNADAAEQNGKIRTDSAMTAAIEAEERLANALRALAELNRLTGPK